MKDREAALWAAVEVFETYPQHGSMADYIGVGAVGRVHEVITKGQDVRLLEEETLRCLEMPLLAMIGSGRIVAQGRKSPVSLLEEIRASDWVGAEIDSEGTCDLVKAGWRAKAHSFEAILGEHERVVWFYDVHLPRDAMLKAFGASADDFLPPAQQAPKAWTQDEFKAAIATCAIADRERAWREEFGPKCEEHGWSNTAFRALWSEARGTKGMTGRPPKPA
ncbi:hypothetical protein ASD76_13950 [Altererythrobacter sp. Root672]|nr:hypothetical protein ASD76_13950 [Altererythrobacter sp. Root672]